MVTSILGLTVDSGQLRSGITFGDSTAEKHNNDFQGAISITEDPWIQSEPLTPI